MALNLTMPERDDLKPRITVFGVGGAGGNAVNNMIEKQLEGVEFVVANTDAQALTHSNARAKIQMGVKVTEGLGAGARPSVGAAAAEETIEEIVDHLAGAHMCFITAGMGGGTGTGAAPIIAQAARELGVLTVGVVTKPFQFEGAKRMKQAEEGVEALQKMVDTLIIIPNQNLFRLANEKTTFTEAFALADDVLYQGVKGVTDLMVRPGLINLDFADVRSVMDEMGKAMMGTGEAEGENRAIEAAEKAIANPLLDEVSLEGAKGVLINITGGYDLTLFELDEAANKIREKVDPDANIIVGSTLDTELNGMMRVSVVATGIDAVQSKADMPVPRRRMAEPLDQPVEAPAQAAAPAPRAAESRAPEFRAPAPQPTAAQAAQAAPQQAPRAEAPRQPSLDVFEPHRAGGDQPMESRYSRETRGEDDMPAPAYQPRPAPQAPTMHEAPAESYVAPRPRSAGEPTPEAMSRLQAAVSKQPQARAPQPQHAPRAEARPEPEQKAGRFGINSIINRMTGSEAQGQAPAPQPQPAPRPSAQAPAYRQQPQTQQAYDDEQEPNPEQERIEIPAFLRRQAN
ncbi:Cell division protein FtsZ [Aquimixticola soesokkakensis]|uniref:Cell division protein FtsZ n=1 Tax=Aquimixticola soesokkakensis TaxID=1519096 RepID=A0A1Y5SDK0_9RHOB|nr:cell division protein FtsZ [Aquimixticola soesokkakensis]SLN35202.1 Cell division protein FtsZ [Aquimixticola soesokkakensis]